jgi:hypothetical protein
MQLFASHRPAIVKIGKGDINQVEEVGSITLQSPSRATVGGFENFSTLAHRPPALGARDKADRAKPGSTARMGDRCPGDTGVGASEDQIVSSTNRDERLSVDDGEPAQWPGINDIQ